jgi:phenylacetic acid degradation operon negative regulatory protein
MSNRPPTAADDTVRGLPSVSRRQDGGSGSARSLLLTVLGEFVLPAGEAPWTATLLHVAGGLGLEEKSARQALARLAADGWITAHRAGRRVRWALTQPGHELLAGGAARIYSFGRDAPAWDGRWLVLLVTVPETRRQLRHKLRSRLTWAGFGSPLPGVWVSPHPAREAEAKQVTEQLGLSAETFSFTGPFAGIGAQRSLVEQAWHLGDLAARYQAFLARFEDLRPAPGDETLLAQIRLVHEWRGFPLADPGLPRELLPPDWLGARAAAVFAGLHRAWDAPARARWQELSAPAGPVAWPARRPARDHGTGERP